MTAQEETWPPMVSIKHVFRAADRYNAIAAVCDDLQPPLHVPAERPEHTVEISRHSGAAIEPRERISAIELEQRHQPPSAGVRSLPALSRLLGPNSRCCWLGRCRF